MSSRLVAGRRMLVLFAVATVVLAGCGDDEKAQSPATSAGPAIEFPKTLPTSPPIVSETDPSKAAPRWEQVKVVTGNAPMELAPVTIVSGAVQWRVKWSCEGGSFIINVTPAPARPGALVSSSCPGQGEGFSRQTGEIKLSVSASGPWKATIEQQVDTPLDEPPLPEMATAQVLSKGDFYNVEKTGKGTARLYQVGNGTALRFENLEVNQNTDLFVWLSTAASPKSSKEATTAQYWVLGNLKSTVGNQNYEIPGNIPIDRVKSIVIWCQPVAIAYAAASLNR